MVIQITLKYSVILVGPKPTFSFFHEDPSCTICINLLTSRQTEKKRVKEAAIRLATAVIKFRNKEVVQNNGMMKLCFSLCGK